MSKRKGAQHLIVAGMAAGKPLKEVAVEAGISERTLRRRLHEVEYIAAITEAQADMTRPLLARLAEMSSTALDVIDSEMRSDDPAARLRAAKTALERLNAQQASSANQQLAVMELRVAAAEAASES